MNWLLHNKELRTDVFFLMTVANTISLIIIAFKV